MEVLIHPFSFREALRHAGAEPAPGPVPETGSEAAELHQRLRRYLVEGGFPEAQGAEPRDRAAALGYEIAVEESSSHGRLDMAVRTGGHVYLFELKVVEMTPPGSALAQLRERRYADKYRGRGEPIHLIGVELSRETRNVTAFEVADGCRRSGSMPRSPTRSSRRK